MAALKPAVRIVIVDDHLMFREALRRVCRDDFRMNLVGEAGSRKGAVEIIRNTRPDIVLLDLNLPDGSGFDVVEEVQPFHPGVRFLALSCHCTDYTLYQVEKADLHGFVDKNSQSIEMLREALRLISQGRCYFSPAFMEAKAARRRDPNCYLKVLSEREQQILCLIGMSQCDQEIADHLGISFKTVETHRGAILRKLGIANTPRLIRFAIEIGLAQFPGRRGASEVYS